MGGKDELRYKLKIKRRYFEGVRREYADLAILDNFISALAEGGQESFFVYNSFGTEASTQLIIKRLLRLGKAVYLPRVEGENIVPVRFCGGDTLEGGAFGIQEPRGQAFDGLIDVTVVPLLAVNGAGYRVGYGGGYYDRYLRRTETKRVGLGYRFQLEEFENDCWDEPLDMFVCEKGIFYFGNSADQRGKK